MSFSSLKKNYIYIYREREIKIVIDAYVYVYIYTNIYFLALSTERT